MPCRRKKKGSRVVPRHASISDVPDGILENILARVSGGTGGLSHALVCRLWHGLAVDVTNVTSFNFSCKSWDPSEADVIREMQALPNLTSVTIRRARSLGDAFLQSIVEHLPGLRSLRIVFPKNTSDTCHFTPQGWTPLLRTCTALTTLNLSCLLAPEGQSWVPPNLQGLSSLRRLNLGDGTDTLPDGFFQHATGLTSLDLRHGIDIPLPPDTWYLSRLRVLRLTLLDLEDCEQVSCLTRLRELHIEETPSSDQANQQILPEEVGSLTSLTSLYVESCSLRFLPASLASLTKLTTLTLLTRGVQVLGFTIRRLRALKHFSLDCSPQMNLAALLSSLPQHTVLELTCPTTPAQLRSVVTQSSLRALSLWQSRRVSSAQAPPKSGALEVALPGLKTLKLSHVQGFPLPLTLLPGLTSFVLDSSVNCSLRFSGQLSSLKVLRIENCLGLVHLPKSLGRLVSLQSFDLVGLKDLQALPGTLGQLSALTELKVSSCSRLSSLPDSVGELCSLQELHLWGLTSLRTLPPSISELQSLTALKLWYMSLSTLPDLPPSAPLAVLDVFNNCSLREIPGSYWRLQHLRSLKISCCERIQCLSEDISSLQSLRNLYLRDLGSLTELPESMGALTGLRSVTLRSLRISSLPEGLTNLTSLSHLGVYRCPQLQPLPPPFLQWALPRVDLESRERLTQLPQP